MKTPRILLGGTHSGCGKTTMTIAVLKALMNRGLKVKSFKCGPDYIDPMFHRKVLGTPAGNLDLFMTGEDTVKYLLKEGSKDFDITVMEGVMGFYDGLGGNSQVSGANHLSLVTQSPAVLVIDVRGMSLSVMAVLEGYLNFDENNIKGVIFNRCSPKIYEILKEETWRRYGIKALGYMPVMKEACLESRHLGLVTAEEIGNMNAIIDILGKQAEQTIDMNGLIALSKESPELLCSDISFKKLSGNPPVIAVAYDKAFSFYYNENFDLMEKMGAKLVFFSPLTDEKLPEHTAGLYLGGGYPEVYIKELTGNIKMRTALKSAIEGGMPCIAECGGYMYLTESIEGSETVGVLKGSSHMTKSLKRFGYITLKAERDNLLCKAGDEIKAHEFHYSDSEFNGTAFTAYKSNGTAYPCIHGSETLFAGYPHINFWSNPNFLYEFLLKASQYILK